MAVDIEKYKLLYEFQQEQFASERQRFTRLEDKSIKYLTSISIAITLYILLIRWAFEKIVPPSDFLGWLTVCSVAITFLAISSAWSFIFQSIKLQNLIKMQSDKTMIEYFKINKREVVYLGLAKKYSEATEKIEIEIEKKLKYINKGYAEIVFSAWCFFISTILIFIKIWP
ncbi:MAG: hypothetical protein COA90_05465 [Gammaproteobacteria bacterium]|nr:MAG: hypothetical protein COA90_05465 [Gammaproteobacteria bacterium]